MSFTRVLTLSLVVVLAACGAKPPRVAAPAPAKTPSRLGPPQIQERGPVAVFGVSEAPHDDMRIKLQRYLSAREVWLLGWEQRRGGMLLAGPVGGTVRLLRVAQPGGARRQLTFADEQIVRAEWIPGSYDSSLALLTAQGPDIRFLDRIDLLEDKRERLAGGGTTYIGRFCWSSKGKLAYSSTARNDRDHDIYVADADSPGSAKRVYEAVGQFEPLDFSPDETKILVRELQSRESSNLYLLNLQNGEASRIVGAVPNSGAGGADGEAAERDAAWVNNAAGRFSADGKRVFFTSDRDAEFLRLYAYDVTHGRVALLHDAGDADVEAIDRSADGQWLAFSVNEGGYSGLYVMRIGARRARPQRVDTDRGVISDVRFSRDPKRASLLGFTLSRPTSPADAYSYDTRTGRLTRWTEGEVGGLNADFFIEPQALGVPTFDQAGEAQRTIPTFLYKPPGPGPHPVLVFLQRRPAGQFRPVFRPWFQFLLMELGVAVVAPNLRGSDGAGKSYRRLDDGPNRLDVPKDVGALLDWIDSDGALDGRRVVLYGESYGALVALNVLATHPGRVRGVIAQAAIYDLPALIRDIPARLSAFYQAEFGDLKQEKIAEILARLSPLDRLGDLRSPVLIIHGAKDTRSPLARSEQAVKGLHEAGRQVGYLVAYGQGHDFQRGDDLGTARVLATSFVAQQLLGTSAASKQDAKSPHP